MIFSPACRANSQICAFNLANCCIVLSLITFHDQNVHCKVSPEFKQLLFSHRTSEFKTNSPMVPSLAPMIVRSSKWSCGFLPLVCVNGVYKIAAANIQWLSVDSSSYSLPAVQHL